MVKRLSLYALDVTILTLCLLAILLLSACGWQADRSAQTKETITVIVPPLTVHSPVGDITTEPVQATMTRQSATVSTEAKTLDVSPPAGTGQAVASAAAATGTPWGAMIGGAISLGVAAFGAKKAVDFRRQRNELIDGVERAKEALPAEAWGHLTTALEAEQNADTKNAVAARTA